jgi:hypothetical protein
MKDRQRPKMATTVDIQSGMHFFEKAAGPAEIHLDLPDGRTISIPREGGKHPFMTSQAGEGVLWYWADGPNPGKVKLERSGSLARSDGFPEVDGGPNT